MIVLSIWQIVHINNFVKPLAVYQILMSAKPHCTKPECVSDAVSGVLVMPDTVQSRTALP